MNDETYMADNAAEEYVPDDYAEDTYDADTGDAAGAEDAEPAAQQDAPQDVSQTQAFSRRLRETQAAYADAQVAAAGLTNPFTGQPIRTTAELAAYSTMQRAEAEGRDPEAAATEADLRQRLSRYEDAEQEQEITADPMLSRYYADYRDDVAQIVAAARADGKSISKADALKAILMSNWSQIQQREADRVREETTRKYNAQAQASPGSIGGGETQPPLDFASMSDEDFEKVYLRATRGELKKS